MENVNPATPAQAAPPANVQPGQAPNPSNPPVNPGAPEGKVYVDVNELAQLRRDAARTKSLQRRADLAKSQPEALNIDPNDPVAVELAQLRRENAEKDRAIREVRLSREVSELFNKPVYKDLPESTKKVILRNPSSLSNADNVEEAIIDIEEFIQAELAPLTPKVEAPAPKGPSGVETPPAPGGGAPAPANSEVLEDLSKLPPSERAIAALRNAAKKQRMGVKS